MNVKVMGYLRMIREAKLTMPKVAAEQAARAQTIRGPGATRILGHSRSALALPVSRCRNSWPRNLSSISDSQRSPPRRPAMVIGHRFADGKAAKRTVGGKNLGPDLGLW
jgi:hypothetical protein